MVVVEQWEYSHLGPKVADQVLLPLLGLLHLIQTQTLVMMNPSAQSA